MNILKQLKEIKPGKTYPSYVTVTEPDGTVIEFICNSFFSGMYCAIYVNGSLGGQTGDHDNKKFCKKLKQDVKKAIARKAKVAIGFIRDCKLTMD